MRLPLLTASRLKNARACMRLDHYRYDLHLRPLGDDSEALTLGILVHVGLEQWWLAHPHERLASAVLAIRQEEADEYAKARAEAMIVGYDLRWLPGMDAYEVLGVEKEFRTPLINPDTGAPSRTFEMAGKIDAIVRERATGRTLIVEHKTSGEDITPGSVYWRKLRMDGQVSIYFAGAKALGFDVQGCIYDVLGKPKQRPLQANSKRDTPETPEEFRTRLIDAIAAADAYYARAEVARTEADLREAEADRWALAIALRDAQRTQVFPRNPDACSNYGRICGFFPICSGDGSIDDPAAFERVENPHPELEHVCPPSAP
jgi:hypothetical protein